jgi:hypothetical protein
MDNYEINGIVITEQEVMDQFKILNKNKPPCSDKL